MARLSVDAMEAMHLPSCISTLAARLFERIPIHEQAHNRKSFASKADTTAVWQRIPQSARDTDLEINPEYLQMKLSDDFIPPPARRVARKTYNSARSVSGSFFLQLFE